MHGGRRSSMSARSRSHDEASDGRAVHLAFSGVIQNVRRLEASLRFYRDLLGLTVLRREQTAAVLGPLGKDRATLTLHEIGAHAVRGLNEVGPRQMWLSVSTRETFDRLSTALADAGYTSRRTESLGLHVLRVRDPDGILLHIVFGRSGGQGVAGEHISSAVYARE
jgi:catechol 2,3-dioxygenase-like lactoylglutathione lyase family enzyme